MLLGHLSMIGIKPTIGGVAEAATCADKFSRENLAVTPFWGYGSEPMDMAPPIAPAPSPWASSARSWTLSSSAPSSG